VSTTTLHEPPRTQAPLPDADDTAPGAAQTILVVDDLPANLEAAARFLTHHGYRVAVAQDGEDAIERAALVHPDLILLDVMMPGLDGFETCRRLKASPASSHIPVIFMTALAETPDKLTGFSVGAVDYVTKPLDVAEVIARMRLHLTLHQLQRRVEARNASLREEIAAHERTQAALRRSNIELEQLAYVASHDLQEPLRMIASYLQLVEERYRDRLDDDGREFIGFAVDGAKRLQKLINDLLHYSRLVSKERPLQQTPCTEVLALALRNLHVAVQESQAIVTHDELPLLAADQTQLVQLFQNLIGNAIKFRSGPGPKVHVGARHDGDAWHFTISDDGIGIAPAHFERVFVLFQRLHSRSRYDGTGIGLTLCKKIVERHGGRIWVSSLPGEGTTFHFTLPPHVDGLARP
jgi:two-component system, sensor histidine kinase and response regulator